VSTRARYYVLAVPAALALPALPAGATLYLSVEQAQRALFGDATRFEAVTVSLADEDLGKIKKASPTRTPVPLDKIWRASDGDRLLGHLIVDEVYGKHEFITYAAAIDPSGAVLGIEILEYRETHGGEVRGAGWRSQFHGKRGTDRLELGEDIVNISGATLSCKHVTDGVKRLLALHDLALRTR
jgi:Na+-translocating ferredoxin:NAD+ oxidoreductase RnfG subunit